MRSRRSRGGQKPERRHRTHIRQEKKHKQAGERVTRRKMMSQEPGTNGQALEQETCKAIRKRWTKSLLKKPQEDKQEAAPTEPQEEAMKRKSPSKATINRAIQLGCTGPHMGATAIKAIGNRNYLFHQCPLPL